MKELVIRQFNPFDLSQILDIERTSFTSDAFSRRVFMRFYLECPDLFLVAVLNNKVRGYMITCSFPKKGHIISIAVNPTHRRRGIGTALAHRTFKRLRACGINIVDLEVRVTNKEGIGFWKKLNFLPSTIAPKFYSDGEDALRMRKKMGNA